MTEIIKYETHFIVKFKKELEIESVQISAEGGKKLMIDLNSKDFVIINGAYHNKYNIMMIEPFKIQSGFRELISKENKDIQKKVYGYMKYYKNELSVGVVKNMILKAKGRLDA